MAANILHFGQELDDRFPLLRNAGFSISVFETFPDFRGALKSRVDHEALSVSELQGDLSLAVVQAARTYSAAPLILFRTGNVIPFPAGGGALAETSRVAKPEFDLVVPVAPSSETWIEDISALIVRSREESRRTREESVRIREESVRIREESIRIREESMRIRRESVQLCAETKEACEKPQFEEGRANTLYTAEAVANGLPVALIDRTLTCAKCGADFVFTAAEQFFFQRRSFTNDPKVCKRCRSQRKNGTAARTHPEFTVKCAECGVLTSVPFKPTQGRPVLCRFCFEKRGVTT